MKFNQLVDDAAEKFARAVILQILQNKHNYKHNSHNYAQNITIILTNSLLTAKNSPSADLIGVTNGNYLKESLIGIIGYPWYVLKEIAIIWTVLNFLQCLFGLFRSAFNTYNLKSLLGPNITLAKIITSGFFGVFSQTIFHVLQSDSTQYKPPLPKKTM